jgi:NAD(P)-dependent dehydrogenase (short-subunit alcohol dehydrogenase family)
MATLSDRSVFITGSDRGIGKAIALAFANAGSRVAVHGLATPALGPLSALTVDAPYRYSVLAPI